MKSNPFEVLWLSRSEGFSTIWPCVLSFLSPSFSFLPLMLSAPLFRALCPLKSKSSAIKESNNSILQRSRCHYVPGMRPHLAALSTATLQRRSVHHSLSGKQMRRHISEIQHLRMWWLYLQISCWHSKMFCTVTETGLRWGKRCIRVTYTHVTDRDYGNYQHTQYIHLTQLLA